MTDIQNTPPTTSPSSQANRPKLGFGSALQPIQRNPRLTNAGSPVSPVTSQPPVAPRLSSTFKSTYAPAPAGQKPLKKYKSPGNNPNIVGTILHGLGVAYSGILAGSLGGSSFVRKAVMVNSKEGLELLKDFVPAGVELVKQATKDVSSLAKYAAKPPSADELNPVKDANGKPVIGPDGKPVLMNRWDSLVEDFPFASSMISIPFTVFAPSYLGSIQRDFREGKPIVAKALPIALVASGVTGAIGKGISGRLSSKLATAEAETAAATGLTAAETEVAAATAKSTYEAAAKKAADVKLQAEDLAAQVADQTQARIAMGTSLDEAMVAAENAVRARAGLAWADMSAAMGEAVKADEYKVIYEAAEKARLEYSAKMSEAVGKANIKNWEQAQSVVRAIHNVSGVIAMAPLRPYISLMGGLGKLYKSGWYLADGTLLGKRVPNAFNAWGEKGMQGMATEVQVLADKIDAGDFKPSVTGSANGYQTIGPPRDLKYGDGKFDTGQPQKLAEADLAAMHKKVNKLAAFRYGREANLMINRAVRRAETAGSRKNTEWNNLISRIDDSGIKLTEAEQGAISIYHNGYYTNIIAFREATGLSIPEILEITRYNANDGAYVTEAMFNLVDNYVTGKITEANYGADWESLLTRLDKTYELLRKTMGEGTQLALSGFGRRLPMDVRNLDVIPFHDALISNLQEVTKDSKASESDKTRSQFLLDLVDRMVEKSREADIQKLLADNPGLDLSAITPDMPLGIWHKDPLNDVDRRAFVQFLWQFSPESVKYNHKNFPSPMRPIIVQAERMKIYHERQVELGGNSSQIGPKTPPGAPPTPESLQNVEDGLDKIIRHFKLNSRKATEDTIKFFNSLSERERYHARLLYKMMKSLDHMHAIFIKNEYQLRNQEIIDAWLNDESIENLLSQNPELTEEGLSQIVSTNPVVMATWEMQKAQESLAKGVATPKQLQVSQEKLAEIAAAEFERITLLKQDQQMLLDAIEEYQNYEEIRIGVLLETEGVDVDILRQLATVDGVNELAGNVPPELSAVPEPVVIASQSAPELKTSDIKYYTKANGEIKYYSTYQSAWNAAARLNKKTEWQHGTWLFEADQTGWYLHFEADPDMAPPVAKPLKAPKEPKPVVAKPDPRYAKLDKEIGILEKAYNDARAAAPPPAPTASKGKAAPAATKYVQNIRLTIDNEVINEYLEIKYQERIDPNDPDGMEFNVNEEGPLFIREGGEKYGVVQILDRTPSSDPTASASDFTTASLVMSKAAVNDFVEYLEDYIGRLKPGHWNYASLTEALASINKQLEYLKYLFGDSFSLAPPPEFAPAGELSLDNKPITDDLILRVIELSEESMPKEKTLNEIANFIYEFFAPIVPMAPKDIKSLLQEYVRDALKAGGFLRMQLYKDPVVKSVPGSGVEWYTDGYRIIPKRMFPKLAKLENGKLYSDPKATKVSINPSAAGEISPAIPSVIKTVLKSPTVFLEFQHATTMGTKGVGIVLLNPKDGKYYLISKETYLLGLGLAENGDAARFQIDSSGKIVFIKNKNGDIVLMGVASQPKGINLETPMTDQELADAVESMLDYATKSALGPIEVSYQPGYGPAAVKPAAKPAPQPPAQLAPVYDAEAAKRVLIANAKAALDAKVQELNDLLAADEIPASAKLAPVDSPAVKAVKDASKSLVVRSVKNFAKPDIGANQDILRDIKSMFKSPAAGKKAIAALKLLAESFPNPAQPEQPYPVVSIYGDSEVLRESLRQLIHFTISALGVKGTENRIAYILDRVQGINPELKKQLLSGAYRSPESIASIPLYDGHHPLTKFASSVSEKIDLALDALDNLRLASERYADINYVDYSAVPGIKPVKMSSYDKLHPAEYVPSYRISADELNFPGITKPEIYVSAALPVEMAIDAISGFIKALEDNAPMRPKYIENTEGFEYEDLGYYEPRLKGFHAVMSPSPLFLSKKNKALKAEVIAVFERIKSSLEALAPQNNIIEKLRISQFGTITAPDNVARLSQIKDALAARPVVDPSLTPAQLRKIVPNKEELLAQRAIRNLDYVTELAMEIAAEELAAVRAAKTTKQLHTAQEALIRKIQRVVNADENLKKAVRENLENPRSAVLEKRSSRGAANIQKMEAAIEKRQTYRVSLSTARVALEASLGINFETTPTTPEQFIQMVRSFTSGEPLPALPEMGVDTELMQHPVVVELGMQAEAAKVKLRNLGYSVIARPGSAADILSKNDFAQIAYDAAVKLGEQNNSIEIQVFTQNGVDYAQFGPSYLPVGSSESPLNQKAVIVVHEGFSGWVDVRSSRARSGERESILNLSEIAALNTQEIKMLTKNESYRAWVLSAGKTAAEHLGEELIAALWKKAEDYAGNLPPVELAQQYSDDLFAGKVPVEVTPGIDQYSQSLPNAQAAYNYAVKSKYGELIASEMLKSNKVPILIYSSINKTIYPSDVTPETYFIDSALKDLYSRHDVPAIGNSRASVELFKKATAFFKWTTLFGSVTWQLGDITTNALWPLLKSEMTLKEEIAAWHQVYNALGKHSIKNNPALEKFLHASGVQSVGFDVQEQKLLRGLQKPATEKNIVFRGIDKIRDWSFALNAATNLIQRHTLFYHFVDEHLKELGIPWEDFLKDEIYLRDPEYMAKVEEFAIRTNDLLGDVANLNKTDKQIFMLVFPFWAWMKQSHKVFYVLAKDHPQNLQFMMYVGMFAMDKDNKKDMQMWDGTVNIFGFNFNTNWLNPIYDVANGPLINLIGSALGDPSYDPGKIIQQVNPMLRLPVAAALGIDLKTLKPVTRPSGSGYYNPETGQEGLKPLIADLPELFGYSIQQIPVLSRIAEALPFKNIPGTRIALGPVSKYGTGEARINPRTGQRNTKQGGALGALSRIVSFPLTGSTLQQQLDISRSSQARLKTIRELQREYERSQVP